MALTPGEQALLDELEASLSASDPALVTTLRGEPAIIVDRRRALVGLLAAVAGLTLLVAGMVSHWSVSVGGFLVMLAGTVSVLRSWQRVDGHLDAEDDVAAAAESPLSAPDRVDVARRPIVDPEG